VTLIRLLAMALLLTACGRPSEAVHRSGDVRIVSVSPAMTETLKAVGLGCSIVGRSAFCRDIDDVPVVGDLADVNLERLVRLRPTHVLVQRAAGDLPAGLERLADEHRWTVVSQHIAGLADVAALLARIGETFPSAAEACSAADFELAEALRSRGAGDGPSLLIIGGGPHPLAWGGDTYLGELVAAAGGRNLIDGATWATLSMEDIARFNPDLVLVPSEAPEPDVSAISNAIPPSRIRVLQARGIELPGPHLAGLAGRIDRLLGVH